MAVFTNMTNMMNKMMNKMKTNKKACCVLCFVLFILFFVTMDTNVYEGLGDLSSAVEENREKLGKSRDKLKNDFNSESKNLGSGPIIGEGPALGSSFDNDYQNFKTDKNNLVNSINNKGLNRLPVPPIPTFPPIPLKK
jgi:histone deacetylase complex regulatory component SIN3